jgi:glycosyltransferase involved in cell wall biosynthesis
VPGVRILWLGRGLLHTHGGANLSCYQLLRHLRMRHDITYVAPSTGSDASKYSEKADDYCNRLITEVSERKVSRFRHLYRIMLSPTPYEIASGQSPEMTSLANRELRDTEYDLVGCDSLYYPNTDLQLNKAPSVLLEHNIRSVVRHRTFRAADNRIQKIYAYTQWRKMLRYEQDYCRRFSAVVAFSPVDREILLHEFGLENVYEFPPAVDSEFFHPLTTERNLTELLFVGTMNYNANLDAVLYFSHRVLPRIAAAIPNVRFTIVGRNPPEEVLALAKANSRITVTGTVEDVRPYYARGGCCVVPLRIGSGRRVKIYEAMAMGTPVVSTTIGAEGLPVSNGENLLIADNEKQFADAIIRVLSDKAMSDKLARQGRQFVTTQGWKEAATAFEKICENLLRNDQ